MFIWEFSLDMLEGEGGFGSSGFTYLDSYFGGECFVGEEVVWLHGNPVWSVNYVGLSPWM